MIQLQIQVEKFSTTVIEAADSEGRKIRISSKVSKDFIFSLY